MCGGIALREAQALKGWGIREVLPDSAIEKMPAFQRHPIWNFPTISYRTLSALTLCITKIRQPLTDNPLLPIKSKKGHASISPIKSKKTCFNSVPSI